MDLRSTIRAVARLPFDPERLIEILCEAELPAALNPQDEEHATFWLVVADQFARRGISSTRARETAIRIIDSGDDLGTQRKLGQTAAGLDKRRRMLGQLRERLTAASTAKPRPTLKEPEPFLMEVGDALIYPTCGGKCWNPYVTRPDQLKIYGPRGGEVWQHDGWGAMVIVEHGRAFGFFAWYRPLIVDRVFTDAPTLEALNQAGWRLEAPGTCSATHFRRMGLQTVGTLPIDVARVHEVFGDLRSGDSSAVSDISIANRMRISSVRGAAFTLHQLGMR
jgi:hypothetical protein